MIGLVSVTRAGKTAAERLKTAWPDGTVLRDALGIGAPAVVTVEHGAVTIALPPRTAAVYRAERGRR